MTRKQEDPETRLLRCTEAHAAGPDAPTRWLRIKRSPADNRRTPLPEPATRAMPQSVLAGLFDAEHAQSKHRALCATHRQAAAASTPAPMEVRRLHAQQRCQTETTVRPLAVADGVDGSNSSGKVRARGPRRAMVQRPRSLRPSRTLALVGGAAIAIIGAMVLITYRAPTPSPAAPMRVPRSAVHAATPRHAGASLPAAAQPTTSAPSPARSEITQAALPAPVRAIPSAAAAIEKLASGDYRGALAAYRELASAFPEQPAYAAAATVLQRRLATRCRQRSETGDPACTLD